MDDRISVAVGDITTMDVDVIVNAANPALRHGGGVAAAIARAGAPDVDRESRAWIDAHGAVGPGEAAVTGAGPMPARHVVHVVGPIYTPGEDNEGMLRTTVRAALDAAAGIDARSVALPAISSGIYGYPPDEACRVIADEANAWLRAGGSLDEIRLVSYNDASAHHFLTALRTQGSGGRRAAPPAHRTDI
jgi:O-acetyl-ADP-ribose deacetylase (regulator of RNase III)